MSVKSCSTFEIGTAKCRDNDGKKQEDMQSLRNNLRRERQKQEGGHN